MNECTPSNTLAWQVHSARSGIVREDTDNARSSGGQIVRMPTITLGAILREQKAPSVIDYLSLDVEGYLTQSID